MIKWVENALCLWLGMAFNLGVGHEAWAKLWNAPNGPRSNSCPGAALQVPKYRRCTDEAISCQPRKLHIGETKSMT